MNENAVRVSALESYWKEQHFENPFSFETWKGMRVEVDSEGRFNCIEFRQWYTVGGEFNWMCDPIENLPSWIKLGEVVSECRIKIAGKDSDCIPRKCHSMSLRCDDRLSFCRIHATSCVYLSLWQEPEDIEMRIESNYATNLEHITSSSHPDNYAHLDVAASPFSKHYLKHIHFLRGWVSNKNQEANAVKCITIGCENTPLETDLQEIWGDFNKGSNTCNFNFKKLSELYDYIVMPEDFGIWFRFNNPVPCYLFIGKDKNDTYHISNDYMISTL